MTMDTSKRTGLTALNAARAEYERAEGQLARALYTLEAFAGDKRTRGTKARQDAFHDLDVATTKAEDARGKLRAAVSGFSHCKTCCDTGEVDINQRTDSIKLAPNFCICWVCHGESK